MNNIYDTQTWEITLLTPLHIGDGGELQLNLDYVQTDDGLEVINLDTLIEDLSDNPAAISEMGRMGFDLTRFVQDYHISINAQYTLPFRGNRPLNNARRFIKDAYGRPYLPGSSLKGALRTALWTGLDRKSLSSSTRYDDFKKRVNSLDGADPHHDFLRPFQVSDSQGIEPDGGLQIKEIKFFNLQSEKKAGWKDFSSRRTMDNFKDAAGIYVEALKAGQKFYLKAGLNQLIRIQPVRSIWKIPECIGLENFQALAKAINSHSLAIAADEKDFFTQYGAATHEITEFYTKLYSKISELSNDSESFILRLSWGSGWKGMTGNWLRDDDLDTVRRKNKLGKNGCPFCKSSWVRWDNNKKINICQNRNCGKKFTDNERWFFPVFPKTRRLAIENGVPCLPLGWILVTAADKEDFRKKVGLATESVAVSVSTKEKVKAENAAPTPSPPDPSNIRKEKLEQFKNMLMKTHNLPGEISFFLVQIKGQEDKELQKQLCQALLADAKNLPKKKKFTKALAAGKKWALALEALCQELDVSV